jgi:hypothetical protein
LLGFADLIPQVAVYLHERKADVDSQILQLAEVLARTIPIANNVVTADKSTIALAFQQLRDRF